MEKIIIELDLMGSTSLMTSTGETLAGTHMEDDAMDCAQSGDVEPALSYFLKTYEPDFKIVAKNDDTGLYENRTATHAEKATCCAEIYFESDEDFATDEAACDLYILWAATGEFQQEIEDLQASA